MLLYISFFTFSVLSDLTFKLISNFLIINDCWMVDIAVQIKISFMYEYNRMGGNLKIVKNFKHFHFGYVTMKLECEKEMVFSSTVSYV